MVKLLDEINLLDIIMNNFHFYNLLISSRSARLVIYHVNDVRVIKKVKKLKNYFLIINPKNIILVCLKIYY